MEMFILILIILIFATAITFSGEIYMYLCLTLGSLMADIKDKLDSIIGRKK
jgi:hypothetical protein